MKAIILHKEREPVASYTPADHEQAGRVALAKDMRDQKIAQEFQYLVGKHAYIVMLFENGKQTEPRRIF